MDREGSKLTIWSVTVFLTLQSFKVSFIHTIVVKKSTF